MTANKTPKVKIAQKGDKISEQYCPKCRDKLIVQMDGGAEVFICDKCKFKIEKKKSK